MTTEFTRVTLASGLVVEVIDSSYEISPYRYPGFLEENAACYLKYEVKNGKCLVVVAQLPDYLGTDVTSGFKEIVVSLSKLLISSGVLRLATVKKPIMQGLKDAFFRKQANERESLAVHSAALEFSRNAGWVACYPPGVGLISNEAFALVRMDESLNYKFDYRRKEVLADFLGVSESRFNIDYEKLEAVGSSLN